MVDRAKRFRAVLEPLGDGLGWVVAWLPFDAAKAWKKMVRQRVTVEVGGELFRTSLFAGARRAGQFVLVNKKMQRAADARSGYDGGVCHCAGPARARGGVAG